MLTADQELAVKSDARVTSVTAGAGSGKTRVIVERVRHMIASGIAPSSIIVFTFTRKAAKEIKERLGDDSVRVGTFHSIALDLLNESSQHVPISEDMSNSIIASINATLKKPITAKVLHACRENRKLGLSSGGADIQRAADTYESRLAHSRAVDFLGMILKAIDLAKTLPAFHVVVDEAQDTDKLQWMLVDELRKDASEFTVGDDAQTLYAFRGVDPELWTGRPTDRKVELGDTFRFGDSIELVSRCILRELGKERVVRTQPGKEGTVNVFPSVAAMLPYAVLAHSQGRSCAILCRYNEQVKSVMDAMRQQNMPVSEKIHVDHSSALALFRYLSAPWSSAAHGEFIANKRAAKLLPTLASDELSTDSACIIAEGWLSSLESKTVGAVIAQLKVPDSLKESFAWWNNTYAGVSLQDAVRDFATLEEVDQRTDGVQVMTIHGSKGLEWDDVFCAFPPVRKFSEEEWRVGYVALTRARTNLGLAGTSNPIVELVEKYVDRFNGVLA